MLLEEYAANPAASRLLAEVVGFETNEIAQEANGTAVVTFAGKRYIDFTGGIAVHACGHNHPEIVNAIRGQAEKVIHTSDVLRHGPQLELAQWLRDLFGRISPHSDWTFLFMNGGSESIDSAAKLALKATGRSKFVAFGGAFHGRTLFASALSRSKTLHWGAYEGFLGPLRQNILHAPAPRCEACAAQKREACCVDGVERLLEEHGPDIAAVFFEPQQGEGGYFPMTPAAAQRLRELTTRYGALLVCDEIQTGVGRTGKWFGFEHLGVEPDIVVFGKAIGGGLPLAGLTARTELMDRWQPGEHGTTFGGNPIACAAGLAALQVMEREGLVERAAELGARITARLKPLVGSCGVADVRGRGLMLAVELRDSEGRPDYVRADVVKLRCRDAGLLLLTCGAKIGDPHTDSAALRLIPPLNTPDAVADAAVDVLIAALREE